MEEESELQQVARLGSNVLVDFNNGDRLTFARLLPSASLKVGNSMCSLAPLINAPYGSAFELQRGSLVQIPPPLPADLAEAQAALNPPADSMLCDEPRGRDNRSLVDDNTAQKLSAQDIDRMRTDCASGKDIVDALIANSSTFHNKTAYSQEKYKKKKQKKYAPFLVIRRPSTRRICEAYAVKCPPKIGFMRMDTVALMLSLGNVGAHAEVLVMDMVSGLLTAAVVERMGGFGSICSVHCAAKPPPLDIVGLLNLTPSMANRVFRVSISELTSALARDDACGLLKESPHTGSAQATTDTGVCLDDDNNKNGSENGTEGLNKNAKPSADDDLNIHKEAEQAMCIDTKQTSGGDIEVATQGEELPVAKEDGRVEQNVSAKKRNSNAARYGRKPDSEDLSHWVKHGFTGLLMGAPEYEPWSVTQILLPLLSPSSPFAIYHQYLQPLADCMHELQVSRMAVALEIVEPWLREYQVLPSRTHPHMQMNATGGYILTGIKIAPN
ncbi:hypothetical protein GOP47_0002342 [Adiantum capillus-veneris]|uniref:tRNA (adenine(58)-N(1))-methyltransferase non-catalytic subunit TRM6 n=1 Tax=Adiantum capillus-veneris TaxID=13818 RepID=A0A9D4ZP41_ADICA|nr:hypothetical protein GOP47_0002342 [Adiantum capillus-veneris]